MATKSFGVWTSSDAVAGTIWLAKRVAGVTRISKYLSFPPREVNMVARTRNFAEVVLAGALKLPVKSKVPVRLTLKFTAIGDEPALRALYSLNTCADASGQTCRTDV